MSQTARQFGPLLREWRQRRRVSQLDLACEGNISTRHLSFLETGRAQPSRDMVLHLAEQLAVPLRDRNLLLAAAGYTAEYPQRPLADPALGAARQAMELVIQGHLPYPALAVDRHWTLVAANDAVPPLLAGVADELLRPPVNVLRVSLHPAGLAPRTANLPEWRAHLLDRLRQQVETSGDPVLLALLAELRGYPAPTAPRSHPAARDYAGMVVPFELVTDAGVLAFFSTTTVFGTPVDVTLSELALECFYPADPTTAAILQRAADTRRENTASSRRPPGSARDSAEGTKSAVGRVAALLFRVLISREPHRHRAEDPVLGWHNPWGRLGAIQKAANSPHRANPCPTLPVT
jgi:transcriptional regulator with XRE-family HTH domain